MKKNLAAIVLAAGKGKRMNSTVVNKVAMLLADKPMIIRTIELLKNLEINSIIVVVGFAKKSVIELLGKNVLFAEQKKRLGTGHAVSVALKKIPAGTENVLVLNGDDSAFYSNAIIKKLIDKHFSSNSSFTFLTIEKDDPHGLGRVVRDKQGKVIAVVEEKDANLSQRKIKEVNPACYIFRLWFLKKYLPKVKKSPITGEYYLTSLIDIGIKNKEKIETLRAGKLVWRGVNTQDELKEAEKLINTIRF